MDRQRTEHTHHNSFRCGSVDHIIAKCSKPPKDNEKQQNIVHFNKRGNHILQKESGNGNDVNDQKIYAYMARMSGSDKSSSRDFDESLQLTNWILDSGATWHTIPQVSGCPRFIIIYRQIH